MLWELGVSELRYRAVLEVLDGATVTSVARRFGVSRGTVHVWLGRYAATGGVVNTGGPLEPFAFVSPSDEAGR